MSQLHYVNSGPASQQYTSDVAASVQKLPVLDVDDCGD